MIHICLDLETWGTTPGSDIRSIGACVFDPATGWVAGHNDGMDDGGIDQMHTFYIACDNPSLPDQSTIPPRMEFAISRDGERFPWDGVSAYRKYPLTRNAQTVKWWSEQSAEAQAAFSEPVDMREALQRFTDWLQQIEFNTDILSGKGPSPHLRIWAHGAAFDPPILAAAYAACGLPVPWHYRAPRDTRTAFDMAGITDHSAHLERYTTGTYHHALDDAICEARAICEAYTRLRRGAAWYAFKERHDVITHRDAWRNAIGIARDSAMSDSESQDDVGYWQHEQDAFDRTFAQLAKLAGEIDNV